MPPFLPGGVSQRKEEEELQQDRQEPVVHLMELGVSGEDYGRESGGEAAFQEGCPEIPIARAGEAVERLAVVAQIGHERAEEEDAEDQGDAQALEFVGEELAVASAAQRRQGEIAGHEEHGLHDREIGQEVAEGEEETTAVGLYVEFVQSRIAGRNVEGHDQQHHDITGVVEAQHANCGGGAREIHTAFSWRDDCV